MDLNTLAEVSNVISAIATVMMLLIMLTTVLEQ